MSFQPIQFSIPRHSVQQRFRTPKKNIPQTVEERNRLLHFIRNYVAEFNPVPPMPSEQLKEHADKVISLLGYDPVYREYIGVLINNEMWRESLAAVPFERRLLLLPKCLRVENKCPAPFDEFGLLCKQCGLCTIQDLQAEAEKLGYAVLVAEGSAIVMSLIQTGKIEAIVGVSCISVLERAFPYMEAAAIPGVAVPLLQDDCIDTTVDLDWVWEYIHLTSEDRTRRLDLGALRDEVEMAFTPPSLELLMGTATGETERIAREWLARAGKRWRPLLTVAACQAVLGTTGSEIPSDLLKLAIAVECFHKASLIHDDIEDGDAVRYGAKTLHEEHGLAVALNVGDLLIGEGYRLIGALKVSDAQKVRMLEVASHGQRVLCRGQGAELSWMRQPHPMPPVQVMDIFRQKTAPAFEVALKVGALYGGLEAYEEVEEVLKVYSDALGVAYQIRDDLTDLGVSGETNDIAGLRPSLLLAIAHERAKGEVRDLTAAIWNRQFPPGITPAHIEQLYIELKADERARTLLETYKEEAIRCLRDLENASLKGLLRRLVGKIFNETEIKGWCKEFEQKNLEASPESITLHSPLAATPPPVTAGT
ncbi:MAG TPA: polyprenyl synthetase [Verrucomicrobiales bacterium]|nr:polyprenyl synthetase [Verrucomicrobiales bacterium]